MRIRTLTAAILSLASSSMVWAIEPFVIKDIHVEGLQRTEPGTVFNYLSIKVGDTFNDERARQAISSLFATGFFDDIRVETEGSNVIIEVTERPVVTQLTINGARDLNKDQIKKSLRVNGFGESYVYDQAVLNMAIQSLKQEYFSRGKYSAEIESKVTRLERNRVAVELNITEGKSAAIKEIRVVGAKQFAEDDIIDEFSLTTGNWVSWLTQDDQYSKQKLSGDLEKLRAYYQNQGFLEFNIDSTQVAISPDKESVFLTININEGDKFTIGEIRFGGDLGVPVEELRSLLQVKPGDVFEREKINNSISAMTDRIGNDGYAFASINVVPEVNKETKVVDFNFIVEPGRKIYVRKINIAGNARTRDEVIRREMRQMEGAIYDTSKIARSKERLNLLGYFEDVTLETVPVQDSIDQVDINIAVKERPTGSFSAGVGYVQGEGVQISASISQANLFGSGKAASLGISTGKANKYATLSYTDPYFTPDGISLGYDLYYRIYNPKDVDRSQYKTSTIGAAIRTGIPVTEYDRVNFSLGVEQIKVTLYDDSPKRYVEFVDDHGRSNTNILGKVSWARDTRDSSVWPTKGAVLNAGLEVGLPGGDIQYYRLTHQQTWYFPLTKDWVLMLNGEVGYADSYGSTKNLPFFQNFYLGGIGSVRGFENGSIGPKDSNDDYLGGNRKAVGNAELLFPMPGLRDNKSVRASLFFDVGSLWDDKYDTTFSSELRYSAGAAITWVSPMGPLKFSYAVPFNTKKDDQQQRFQFQMGGTF